MTCCLVPFNWKDWELSFGLSTCKANALLLSQWPIPASCPIDGDLGNPAVISSSGRENNGRGVLKQPGVLFLNAKMARSRQFPVLTTCLLTPAIRSALVLATWPGTSMKRNGAFYRRRRQAHQNERPGEASLLAALIILRIQGIFFLRWG